MTLLEVKKNLNKPVLYSSQKLGIKNRECLLNGCILRMDEYGNLYYSVELKEIGHNSVIVTLMENVEVKE